MAYQVVFYEPNGMTRRNGGASYGAPAYGGYGGYGGVYGSSSIYGGARPASDILEIFS